MSDEKRLQRALLDDDQRTLENIVVLYLSQAMLGLVSANLRAVAAEVTPDRLMIHFAFSELSQQDREDVEDIVADLDALLTTR